MSLNPCPTSWQLDSIRHVVTSPKVLFSYLHIYIWFNISHTYNVNITWNVHVLVLGHSAVNHMLGKDPNLDFQHQWKKTEHRVRYTYSFRTGEEWVAVSLSYISCLSQLMSSVFSELLMMSQQITQRATE